MIRKIMIFVSVMAAALLASYGHDTQQMDLWAIGMLWIATVMLAQLWTPAKKKRHRKSSDTNSLSKQFHFLNNTGSVELQ